VNTGDRIPPTPRLPEWARLPINRCNLPASLLGGLGFQLHPTPLTLDGVHELHNALFVALTKEVDPAQRAEIFQTHMSAAFLLDHPDEAGYEPDDKRPGRGKLDYRRLLRGWLFDADSREGAVMKGWVESRFGLLARHHGGPLGDYTGESYEHYLVQRARGLYNTNALEAQLDLLFSYCQFEVTRRWPGSSHIRLYRGINHIGEHEVIEQRDRRHLVLLLNNLNSFSDEPDRAGEFGDEVISTEVPLAKLIYFPDLLSGMFQGEREYLVLGGIYEARIETLLGR